MRYDSGLFRLIASLLLAVLSTGFVAPVVVGASESNVPLCCRKDGKHKCEMSQARAEVPGGGVSAVSAHAKCPLYPRRAPPSRAQYTGAETAIVSRQLFVPMRAEASHAFQPINRHVSRQFPRGPPFLS